MKHYMKILAGITLLIFAMFCMPIAGSIVKESHLVGTAVLQVYFIYTVLLVCSSLSAGVLIGQGTWGLRKNNP